MGDKPFPVSDLLLQFDPSSELPIYLQLYEQLRAAIVNDCRIPRCAKLPSTRSLSETLRISRNTVIAAFEQLLAEGYLEGRIGSGTYVAHALPESCLGARPQASAPGYGRPPARISARGRRMKQMMPSTNITHVVPAPSKPRAFRLHAPSFEAFPYDAWRKMSLRTWERIRPEMLGYGCPAGWQPLREAVAHYLRAARAVRCDWQQVIITSGAKQAMHLVAQSMTDPGDPVFIENPSYSGIRIAFTLSGAEMLPVPVDHEGLDIAAAEQMCPEGRLVYVTPSHQYPLGATMSLNRRLALLDWARRRDGFIIEDDYDSEFRYRGHPVASLQGLDREDRVLYIGTFSKVLMPSLRLGYMVVPPDLVDTFIAARAHYDWSSPIIEQATLAEFMSEGHFARFIRRNRALYAERQEILLDAGKRHLRGLVDLQPKDCGMHLLGWLPKGFDDRDCAALLYENGVEALALSQFASAPSDPGGLLLGYAPFDARTIEAGAEKMAAVLERQVALYR
ncbi:MAG: PLP-dependent aminotransferase family protein [Acidobacteria bacterium]|nr:PLP-dependent aminotransferase family protein [Acidobacteriota bacterium]